MCVDVSVMTVSTEDGTAKKGATGPVAERPSMTVAGPWCMAVWVLYSVSVTMYSPERRGVASDVADRVLFQCPFAPAGGGE